MRNVLLPVVGTPVIEEVGRSGLPTNVQQWPDDWLEAYEERVAIMQFDGQLDAADAEREAEAACRHLFSISTTAT
jgi:hypothetical protein